jgi:hypothetical protein
VSSCVIVVRAYTFRVANLLLGSHCLYI